MDGVQTQLDILRAQLVHEDGNRGNLDADMFNNKRARSGGRPTSSAENPGSMVQNAWGIVRRVCSRLEDGRKWSREFVERKMIEWNEASAPGRVVDDFVWAVITNGTSLSAHSLTLRKSF